MKRAEIASQVNTFRKFSTQAIKCSDFTLWATKNSSFYHLHSIDASINQSEMLKIVGVPIRQHNFEK